jgi:hypothetical protein
MKPLTIAAVSALILGAASAWAQSAPPPLSLGCNRSTGDIADCLNRAVADRNDAATAYYGDSGVMRHDMAPPVPAPPAATTTTTTTTTYSRTIYPPAYPGTGR